MSNSNSKNWFLDWLSDNYISASEYFFPNLLQSFHMQKSFNCQSFKSNLSRKIPFHRLDSVGNIGSDSHTSSLSTYKKCSSNFSTLVNRTMSFLNYSTMAVSLVQAPQKPVSQCSVSIPNDFQFSGLTASENHCFDRLSDSKSLQTKSTMDLEKYNPFLHTICSVNPKQGCINNSQLLNCCTESFNASNDSNNLHLSRIASFKLKNFSEKNSNRFDCKRIDMQSSSSLPLDTKDIMLANEKKTEEKIEVTTVSVFANGKTTFCGKCCLDCTECIGNCKDKPTVNLFVNSWECSGNESDSSDCDTNTGFESDFEDNISLSESEISQDSEQEIYVNEDAKINHDMNYFQESDADRKADGFGLLSADDTDSDNASCQWERLCSARTPWTCHQAKRSQNKTLVNLSDNSALHNKSGCVSSHDSNETFRNLRIKTFNFEESNEALPNTVIRPSCENNIVSYILGCPEDGYESDKESNASWSSDSECCEKTLVNSSSISNCFMQADDNHNTTQSSDDSCLLWDYFLKKQSPFFNTLNTSSFADCENRKSETRSSSSSSYSDLSRSQQPKLPSKVRIFVFLTKFYIAVEGLKSSEQLPNIYCNFL